MLSRFALELWHTVQQLEVWLIEPREMKSRMPWSNGAKKRAFQGSTAAI